MSKNARSFTVFIVYLLASQIRIGGIERCGYAKRGWNDRRLDGRISCALLTN